MNVLTGQIETITIQGSLSLVRVLVDQIPLTAIVIDTPETAAYLVPDNVIKVIFKETEVIVGKGGDHQISLQNRLSGRIHAIETGQLLSRLVIDTHAGQVVSVITANAVEQLALKVGSEVTAMIKTNEIMLSQ
ncbi:MAG: TOBE domain-containing protein [Marinilabiliaceae bacterium]|nr:TOBE domain-containing protein [Marinilabiliaceae bacterium]